jgi:serine/threonine/tyrosine-interacting protein
MNSNTDMGTARKNYVPTQDYDDKRALEPERIVIPAPNIEFTAGTPAFNVDTQHFDHVNESCGNPIFMQSIRSLHKLELQHQMLSWKYEHRRHAQLILPFLFLGPSTVAQNADFVQSNGITFMVAVRSTFTIRKLPKYLDPTYFASAKGLDSAVIDLDTPYDLARNLRRIIKAMNDHLQKSCAQHPISSINDIRAKIIVFCESGNERSTVVVCAYLMVVYGLDAVSAIQVVQSQRFCIDVKDEMKNMLFDTESLLVAERQVAAAARAQEEVKLAMALSPNSLDTPQLLTLNKSSKRNLDEAYASDEEMEDSFEWSGPAYSNRRVGSAPFADVGS